MQSQFGSISLVAAAYERDLRADAARVRPVRIAGVDGAGRLGRVRDAVGRGLVRVGQRLQGTRSPELGSGMAPQSLP
jgi:hypothetical protein